MTRTQELTDKLDVITSPTTNVADDVVMNGPDGKALKWEGVAWRSTERTVRRLRQRIFTASKTGDLKKVRNLQKLMLRCHSNALVSVRTVTERNAGRQTAGVDGEVIVSSPQKVKLAKQLQQSTSPRSTKPVRRVHIPKANGKQRPLGISTIRDRCRQAVVKNALEPEWEARFEPRSYGFRPGRSCHDAIEAIYSTLHGNAKRLWILDADLTTAFDSIDHAQLLEALGTFPAREMIAGWLRTGVIEHGRFTPTESGTPQGGVVSPILLNIALHGLEHAAGVRYRTTGTKAGETEPDSPILVRYADDFVVMCHSERDAREVKAKLGVWLNERTLAFNIDKTQIVSADDGFDFLGFNVRRYNDKLFIKPSKSALKAYRKRLSTEMRSLRGKDVGAVLQRINPIIRGWCAYYRSAVSSDAFSSLDTHMWRLTYKWASRTHYNKSKHWVVNRYFGMFNRSRRDRWVFGNRHDGSYLLKHKWTAITRHAMVKMAASPDDPALSDYWKQRRRRNRPPLRESRLRMLKAQHGRCPLCNSNLIDDGDPQSPEEWEGWIYSASQTVWARSLTIRQSGQPDVLRERLVHARCYRRHLAATQRAILRTSTSQ